MSKRLKTSVRLIVIALAVACATVISSACDRKADVTLVSHDRAALRDAFELELPMETVRWEVFETPEYKGGVPGPTDYVTLIAEVTPADPQTSGARQETGLVWIVPEAARPWLAEDFRSMLSAHRNTAVNLSSVFDCRKFQAKLRKSSRPVDGFICHASGKSLVYLTLSD